MKGGGGEREKTKTNIMYKRVKWILPLNVRETTSCKQYMHKTLHQTIHETGRGEGKKWEEGGGGGGGGGEGISTAISISESTNQSLSRYANSSPAYLHANNPTDVPKRALWVLILNGLADLTGKDNVSTRLAPVTGTFLK